MGARERNARETRRRILDVCGRLFRANGYDGTTIDEIISAAEVSRQTFFNHFPGKQAAVTELWLDWLDQQGSVPPADPDPKAPGGVLPAIRSAVVAQARAVEADRDFMALLFTYSSGFPGSVERTGRLLDETRDRAGRIFDRVAGVIAAGQLSGEIHPDLEPRRAAEIYVSAMVMTMRLWLLGYSNDGERLEERMTIAVDLIERGISCDPGSAGQPERGPDR